MISFSSFGKIPPKPKAPNSPDKHASQCCFPRSTGIFNFLPNFPYILVGEQGRKAIQVPCQYLPRSRRGHYSNRSIHETLPSCLQMAEGREKVKDLYMYFVLEFNSHWCCKLAFSWREDIVTCVKYSMT